MVHMTWHLTCNDLHVDIVVTICLARVLSILIMDIASHLGHPYNKKLDANVDVPSSYIFLDVLTSTKI